MKITVSAFWYTFIKGTGGIWVTKPGDKVFVDERGLERDRKWVVVDEREHNMFVTQRSSNGQGIEVISMCQITARIECGGLVLRAPGMEDLHLPFDGTVAPVVTVQVWSNSSLYGVDEGKAVSAWLSEFLSRERPGTYRLVRMAMTCRRPSKRGGSIMGFHDAYPFMIISSESLGGLNGKLLKNNEDAVQMRRFRPNIVFSGCGAHAEDLWSRFRIGGVEFYGGTLCDRCAVIRTDQTKAVRHKSEPTATLATYRKGTHLLADFRYCDRRELGIEVKPNAVFFGRNADFDLDGERRNGGMMCVGDEVEIL